MTKRPSYNPSSLVPKSVNTGLRKPLVRHLIHEIIFCLQLVFAFSFLVVHKSALTKMNGKEFLEISMVLSGYVGFSCWYLYRSLRKTLSLSDVFISIFFDYAVFFALIITPQIEARLMDTNILRVPLFSFVYVFIAMRALHFQPITVVFSGFLATLIWSFTLFQRWPHIKKTAENLKGDMFLGDFFAVGGLDPFLSIFSITVALSYFISVSRRHVAVLNRGLMLHEFSRQRRRPISRSEPKVADGPLVAGKGRKLVGAVMHINIRDFSFLASILDPTETIRLLGSYRQIIESLIKPHGGTLDKHMGDSVLVHFGLINPSPHFVAQMLRCAEDISESLERWNQKRVSSKFQPLDIRIACTAGTGIIGLVVGTQHQEFTFVGEPVHLALRLQKHSLRIDASIVTTSSCLEIARFQGYVPKWPTRQVRLEQVMGVTNPMDLVVIKDSQSRSPIIPRVI